MAKTKHADKGVDKVGAAFRRVGSWGNKKALRTGDDVYVDPATRRRLRQAKTAEKKGLEDEVKSLTTKGKNRIIAVAATATALAYWKYGGEEYKTRAAAEKAKAKDQKDQKDKNTISDEEMADIDKQIAKKKQKTSAKKRKAEYAAHSKKQTKAAAAKKEKRRLIFGEDAIIRPFGGKIANLLLGKDQKFGGKKGLIDFLNTGGSVTGLSKAQQNMLRQAQQHARSTGQNPKTLQDLVAKYGNQLKGGGRKGKLKGAPRPGGRRNGGEAIAPPPPRIRRTPPAAPAPAASGLSQAQQNLLRGAQQHSRSTGQNPQALQNLTAQHGQLLKPRQGRKAMLPGAPAPGGMKHGGPVGKKGRSSKPRGVGAATRGYGRAMKK